MQQQALRQLLQDLEQELLRLGYTKGTMTFYRNRWRMRILTLWLRISLTGTTIAI